MNTGQNRRDSLRDRPEPDLQWKPIETDKTGWLFSENQEADLERGCIGHLRGDFGGSGTEFWTSWFTHQSGLLTSAFRDELQGVVNRLREKGGLLSGFDQMRKLCRSGTSVDDSYGFHAESRNYEYCLRCIPVRGSYHLYLYCYDKNAQREYMQRREKQQPLRDKLKQPIPPVQRKGHKPVAPER